MTGYLLVLLLSAGPARAQEGAVPQAGVSASTSAVAVSTAALSGPELKRLRNSELAVLKKKQAAETEALARSMKGKPGPEARRAMKELKAAHQRELAALKARHAGKKAAAEPKDGAAGGEGGGDGKASPAGEKKP